MPDVRWYAGHRGGLFSGTVTMASGTQFSLPNGSAAAPALIFSTSPATGIYWDTAAVSISVTGTQRWNMGSNNMSIFSDTGSIRVGAAGDCQLNKSATGIWQVKQTLNFTGPTTTLPVSGSASPFGYVIFQVEGASRFMPFWA